MNNLINDQHYDFEKKRNFPESSFINLREVYDKCILSLFSILPLFFTVVTYYVYVCCFLLEMSGIWQGKQNTLRWKCFYWKMYLLGQSVQCKSLSPEKFTVFNFKSRSFLLMSCSKFLLLVAQSCKIWKIYLDLFTCL